MCVTLYLTEGDETHEIDTQGGVAALVEGGEIAMLPGYTYGAGDCLCGVDLHRTLIPEGYRVERDDDGDWRAKQGPC